MRLQKSIISRGGLLAVLALVLLAVVLTGCGIGPATNQEKISGIATTYLKALADGDAGKACAQLTRRARSGGCEAAMKIRFSRLDPDALKNAADGSMDIEVNGKRATAGLSQPEGTRFLLVKVGGDWRINSGYTLSR